MTVRRILWFQALILVVLTGLSLCHRLLPYPSSLYNLAEFLVVILVYYSILLFPVIAFVRLLLRKPDELSDFEITWSLIAGLLLYMIGMFIALPMVQ